MRVVPPISFARIDVISRRDGNLPSRAWAREFAEMLRVSDCTPLYGGEWTLGASNSVGQFEGAPSLLSPAEVRAIVSRRSHGYCDWDRAVLPLMMRDVSAPDDGRVKAFRKLARNGTLPPVLLWWVSGLCACVVLDGHDRLLAASLEGVSIAALYLEAVQDVDVGDAARVAVLERIEKHPIPTRQANELVLAMFPRSENVLTRARALPGGFARWQDEVRQELRVQRIDDPECVEGLGV